MSRIDDTTHDITNNTKMSQYCFKGNFWGDFGPFNNVSLHNTQT